MPQIRAYQDFVRGYERYVQSLKLELITFSANFPLTITGYHSQPGSGEHALEREDF